MSSSDISPAPTPPSRPTLLGALRTRLLWLLVRALPSERLRRLRAGPAGWLIRTLLLRGELQVLGGPVPRLRIAAPYFDYTSAIAHPVLTGNHEPMVQEALRRTVWPGGVVLDVGASAGPVSLLAAWLAGPAGQVICIEPQRRAVEALRANAAANGFANILALHAAAGSQPGRSEIVITADPLWTVTTGVGDHPLRTSSERVQIVAVDDLVARGEIPRPQVVKIDVEGSELEVLGGMSELLSKTRPAVIAEMHDHNREFCRVMADHDYEVTNLEGPQPVEEAEPNIHVLCLPRNGLTSLSTDDVQ